MENFFYEEHFCSDIKDLLGVLDIDEEDIVDLPERWRVGVELSNLEPIFSVDADTICQLFADANEDRLSEEFGEEEEYIDAFRDSIDFGKLHELLPKLYYPNGSFIIVNKLDLADYLNNSKRLRGGEQDSPISEKDDKVQLIDDSELYEVLPPMKFAADKESFDAWINAYGLDVLKKRYDRFVSNSNIW